MRPAPPRHSFLGDLLVAILVAGVMTLAGVWRDWANLSALHLPDTDDVMRLQQIRDWLGGQAFIDVSQHRLGAAPGLAMHWSRVADLVPAGMITVLTPALGRHGAELATVIAWPALLFAAALLFVARVTRRVEPQADARAAIVIAALAYPATGIFVPGRIDHHGLQMVLLLGALAALLARRGVLAGIVIGLASAASLMIGLETAPLLAMIALVIAVDWWRGAESASGSLRGYGLSLGLALSFGAIVFGGTAWRYPACDGFTETAWAVAEGGAWVAVALGVTGPALTSVIQRTALAGVALAAFLGIEHAGLSACAHPYAGIDPMLAHLWLPQVSEAQPLIGLPVAQAIGYGGVMVAGLAAALWRLGMTGQRGWLIMALVQGAALAISCFEVRGAYAGALLAAPALASLVTAAREAGLLRLIAAWLASAGMLYPIAAQALAPRALAVSQPGSAGCATPAAIASLAALPPGTVMAPMDFGAYAIAGTRDLLVAAPYHRNNAGNLAMYRFYLGTPAQAHGIAAHWGVRYVVACDGALAEAGPGAGRMIDALRRHQPPAWLKPLVRVPGGPTIYGRVD